MAGPNQTGDEDNKEENLRKEEEAALKLKAERLTPAQDESQTPQESVMVGRDANNIGENATSNAALDTTIAATPGPNAQDITDDNTPTESVFTASPHSNKVAMEQINKGLQGIEGAIAGVMGINTTATQEEERKRKDSLANIAAITATNAIANMNNLMADLDALIEQRQELFQELEQSKAALNNLVSSLRDAGNMEDAQIVEDVIEMKDYVVVDYKGEEHIVFKDEKDPKKMYVIDNNDNGERVYINDMKPEARALAWADIRVQDGQKTGDENPEHALKLEESRRKLDEKPKLKELFQEADKGQYNVQQKIDDLNNEIDAKKEEIASFYEEKTADGTLSKTDMAELRSIMKGAPELNALAVELGTKAHESGVEIEGLAKGADASEFLALQLAATADLEQTQKEITETQESKTQQESSLDEQNIAIDSTSAIIEERTTSGSQSDIAAANLAVQAIDTERNMSLMVSVIEDINGNAVHKNFDNDGNPDYYHVKDDGTRDYYTPEEDAQQIANFNAGLDGNESNGTNSTLSTSPQNFSPIPGMSSSALENDTLNNLLGNISPIPPAPKTFANIGMDATVAQALVSKDSAQENIETIKQELSDTSNRLENLEVQEAQEQELVANIKQVLADIESGTLSGEEAKTVLATLKEQADTTTDTTQWETSETHTLQVPDHDFADAEASRNAALEKVALAVLNGTSLSQEDYDTLKDAPGMSATQLDTMMAENQISLENNPSPATGNSNNPPKNTVSAATNTATVMHFGQTYTPATIPAPTTPTSERNGISIEPNSFADSMAFGKYNDPSSQTNSFDPVAVKQGENPPAATEGFAASLIEKPAESGSSTNGLTPQQAEQLRAEEINQQQAQLAALTAQGAGAGGGGGGAV